MHLSPKKIGLRQALGLILYVCAFAFLASILAPILEAGVSDLHPAFPISLFLLTFVTSALICANIAFAYPSYLIFKDKKTEALHAIIWTAAWLAAALAVFILGALFVGMLF